MEGFIYFVCQSGPLEQLQVSGRSRRGAGGKPDASTDGFSRVARWGEIAPHPLIDVKNLGLISEKTARRKYIFPDAHFRN